VRKNPHWLKSLRQMTNTKWRCPICDRWFDPAESRALPFCSERCRLIDLARWLGEKYRIPGEEVPAPEPEEPEKPEVK
jgi:endogenous inhibitor of DNA gyrase (YacG/DUF329 family)